MSLHPPRTPPCLSIIFSPAPPARAVRPLLPCGFDGHAGVTVTPVVVDLPIG
jgi:hypothetical protein